MHLKRNFFYTVIGLSILLASCRQDIKEERMAEVQIPRVKEKDRLSIILESPEKLSNTLTPIEIKITNDYSFEKEMRYKCFKLEEVMEHYFDLDNLDSKDDIIFTFNCHDGYRASQMLKDIRTHEGFLAFADLDQNDGSYWADSLADMFPPYYLVWLDREKGDKEMVWPFGVISIELDNYDHKYKGIAPPKGLGLTTGFSDFRKYCIKCHSINKIGGELGPELNYPKNILEYWEEEDIWGFVRDSRKYRYNSKMPKVDIEKEEFEGIIAYLEYIKEHKLE